MFEIMSICLGKSFIHVFLNKFWKHVTMPWSAAIFSLLQYLKGIKMETVFSLQGRSLFHFRLGLRQFSPVATPKIKPWNSGTHLYNVLLLENFWSNGLFLENFWRCFEHVFLKTLTWRLLEKFQKYKDTNEGLQQNMWGSRFISKWNGNRNRFSKLDMKTFTSFWQKSSNKLYN